MKDWKAECEKLRGELSEVRKQLEYERRCREQRSSSDYELREKFKELLIEVLGR